MNRYCGRRISAVAQIEAFHAIAIGRIAHQLRSERRTVIHMEFGQPSTGARAAAHHVLDTGGLSYWESPKLKDRIARIYADRYGVTIDPERMTLEINAVGPRLSEIIMINQ